MLVFPNCKINIGLNIVERLPNGFHLLESVLYPINWCDALEILPQNEDLDPTTPFFTSSGLVIDPKNHQNHQNICIEAYQLLKKDFDLPKIMMHLHKNIPIGAGLGGGSSDGAFALKTLNNLFNLDLSPTLLEQYASRLGSDCPFFIQNQAAYLYGTGKELTPIDLDLSPYNILLVNPNIAISTAEAYGLVRAKGKNEVSLSQIVLEKSIKDWKNEVINDFETFLFPKYPVLNDIKQKMYDLGSIYAAMSGSGSTLFGIFDKKVDTKHHFPNYQCHQIKSD